MKSRDLTRTRPEPAQAGDARPGGGKLAPAQQTDESWDLVDGAQLLRILEENQDQFSNPAEAASVPRITRMPDGIEVVEQRLGRAAGQWVMRVRCQCGRGWFELEAIHAATCPRCGLIVYVDVEAPIPPR